MKDVIIVGGGLAGLSAAWRLKHHDILLLESDGRIGGRVMSERRGDFWLNWGGHVYAGEGSATDELFKSVGVSSLPVPGILTAMSLNGTLLKKGPVESYPFRVPMSWESRLALVKAGAKVKASVLRYGSIAKRKPHEDYASRQQRILEFMNNKTFSEYTGILPEDADAIFRPTVSRSTGDPEEISAGAGVGYFHTIWDKSSGLSRNVLGGPSTLTDTIASIIAGSVSLNTEVTEVVQHEDHVTVTYVKDGITHVEDARYAVLATPAPITRKIAVNMDQKLSDALGEIKYGPHVSAAILTDETEPQVWDDVYSFATPKKSFDILIHCSNLTHSQKVQRKQGSSFMTFSPAGRGRALMDKSEEEITDLYLKDLDSIFPGFSSHVKEVHVRKFPYGSAYIYPGRAKIQTTLTGHDDRLFLAGDYLGTLYTETAIQTGFTAAQHINSMLNYTMSETARDSTLNTV
ncbi:NAD(P)/FAD-dependent oxidoreductase [Lacicoccus qingdaonensis]|uniref:Oxygen-dependent protoporphyrinogen oxidase n=1 Tax=Lacicoccus qingdaonensis TaxID=576118 RepID=A0A1G9B018_9BACL|nr:NAD(P)/FAD-dependent oxidoreductase [Salinicoccus qingdaonensis]SDK32919.1 oxygen-dependent protoporphyrinogen oxidase [Salinicoccus qingdaonensis]